MTEGTLKKLIVAADATFTQHLRDAGAKTATESCPECARYQGKLEAFEEVRQVLRAERHKARVKQ